MVQKKKKNKEKEMKEKMIMWAVTMFIERMNGEDLKKWIDMGLDIIEDKVEASESTTDDMIVLPICKIVREALSVPDND
jgi:hypothetical protein